MDLRKLMLCLALGLCSGQAAARDAAAPDCGIDVPIIDLLHPDTPQAPRLAASQRLHAAAQDQSCPYARYLLGTLLRFGPELPGNAVEKDPARAEELLEPYARLGHIWAYSDLAELALAQGDSVSAMKWTQVYLYFATRHGEALEDFDRTGYNANLLLRADRAWRKARRPAGMTVNTVLGEYLSVHRDSVSAAMRQKRAEIARNGSASGDTSVADAPLVIKRRPPPVSERDFRMEPGYAVFLLEILPSGQVNRIVAESFAPGPEQMRKLRALVEGFEFQPFDSPEPRVARVPAQYGFVGWSSPSLKLPKQAAR